VFNDLNVELLALFLFFVLFMKANIMGRKPQYVTAY
jgi:hypothetical protein